VKVTLKYLLNDCETGPSMVKEKFTLDDRDQQIVCALLKRWAISPATRLRELQTSYCFS
jgi:hypothetical protein